MKTLITIAALFMFESTLFATGSIEPKEKQSYKVITDFTVKLYTDDECVEGNKYSVCAGQIFKVLSVTGEIVVIKITGTKWCGDTQAITGSSYCMEKSKFSTANVEEHEDIPNVKGGVAVVLFAVPMKFDFKTYKVYPGGEIGGAVGYRLRFKDKDIPNKAATYSTSLNGIVFGGFTTVPLNDVNSSSATEISSVGAFSWGGGIGYTFNGGVQVGAYLGIDYYNFGGTKYRNSWISIGIGYEFIRIFDADRR